MMRGAVVQQTQQQNQNENNAANFDIAEVNGLISQHMGRLFSYLRDRNDWLDQRMIEQDKRFERIDRNSARILETIEAGDFGGGSVGNRRSIGKGGGGEGMDWRRIKRLEDG